VPERLGKKGWGSLTVILWVEIGILGGKTGLRDDNLDILEFRGVLRD
jgi:hypothetical protein